MSWKRSHAWLVMPTMLALAACAHDPSRYVATWGKDTYRTDEGAVVASRFCERKGKGMVMQPLQSGEQTGNRWVDSDSVVFQCVPATQATLPDVKPISHAPSG
jgi:hypothetical protein